MFEWQDVMASQQRRFETLPGRCKRSSSRIHGLDVRQQRCAMRPIGAVNNLPASVLKGCDLISTLKCNIEHATDNAEHHLGETETSMTKNVADGQSR